MNAKQLTREIKEVVATIKGRRAELKPCPFCGGGNLSCRWTATMVI